MWFFLFLLIASPTWITSLDTSEIVIVIVSQPEGFHLAHAKMLKHKIIDEAESFRLNPPKVILTHEEHLNGSWTFFPQIPLLSNRYPDAKWFLFCLENTSINLINLQTVLSKLTSSKKYFVGYALYDEEPTIIHHFAEKKRFSYPNIASGFAISNELLHSLNEKMEKNGLPVVDFSIDSSYEFASYVRDNGKGTRLTHLPEFCLFFNENCATYPKAFHSCASSVSPKDVFIAVKTFKDNHKERIPIVMKTWLKYAPNFGLFTNEKDKNLANVFIVPHTTKGHCAKTYGILEESVKILHQKNIKWLVVSDDDTILSVSRLTKLLTCYNPKDDVALGERYGYRVTETSGYDYLTGGAGLVLSRPLLKKIIESPHCKCPTPTTPDDMYLFGVCLKYLGIKPTHSPLFHQARPSDYSLSYLSSQEPVSFHKFWMINPTHVYEKWFADADKSLESTWEHTEL